MQLHIKLPFTQYGELNITGNTLEELFPALDLLAAKGLIPSPQQTVPNEVHDVATAAQQTAEQGVAEAPAKEKPTRKPKAEKTTAEAKTEPKLTIADVTDAVTRLANKKGVAVARGLIQKFGVAKASEVKAEDFAKFIVEAKALTEAEEAEESAEDVL